jgi:uncharacterized protein
MAISDLFDWDEANIAHIAEHGIAPQGAEEVVLNTPLDLEYSVRNDELRLRQAGETVARRVLAVVTTVRNGSTRVITAYPASRSLRATYRSFKKQVKDGKANPS